MPTPESLALLTQKEQDRWLNRFALVEEVRNDGEIERKLRQLEAMGFDHKGEGWQ
jgi:hypothetical protein